MKPGVIVFLFLMSFLMLYGEQADSLRDEITVISFSEEADNSVTEETDEFIDKNGDGIDDRRTFRERITSWRQTRTISRKILGSGLGSNIDAWESGRKNKSDRPGSNSGNINGNGDS